MKCPHCSTAANFRWTETNVIIYQDENSEAIKYAVCPECNKIIIHKIIGKVHSDFQTGDSILETLKEERLYPLYQKRSCAIEVPEKYSSDYIEASLILELSPKSSAALSRRILQHIIREEYKINKKSLAEEITELLNQNNFPTLLSEAIDAIRVIGNFAAHPLKDTNTGEIIDVEVGEAEWTLNVVESLFDYTFVQPAKLKENKDKLNIKLLGAGKKPIK